MKRITVRREHGVLVRPKYDFHIDPNDYDVVQVILAKLAAYEDTGMTPEQIRNAQDTLQCFDNIGIKRGNEIVKAEEEGRLVVLPCKIGKTVYKISYYHDCADNLYETCQLFAYDESACCRCYKDKLVPHIRESGFELSMLDDLGEAVFLSREEAKAALEDIRHENP